MNQAGVRAASQEGGRRGGYRDEHKILTNILIQSRKRNRHFTDTENTATVNLFPCGDIGDAGPLLRRTPIPTLPTTWRCLGVAADWLERPPKAKRVWQRARSPRACKTFQQCG